GAYITHDREQGGNRLVSEFIAEFDGLTGSGKRTKVLDAAGLKRARLADLADGERLDAGRISTLLQVMKEMTRPGKAQRLGIIGADHFKARLLAMGIEEESFTYHRELAKEGMPWVLETAFGYLGESGECRRIYTGVNWSAAIRNPFRSFGSTGEGLETLLAD